MALSLDDIAGLFLSAGSARYGGEAINQLQHALQCAHLAERANSSPHLITAALLHDLGHLLPGQIRGGESADDLHQYVAIPFLRGVFPAAVLEPIRLHVDAKRYLCHADNGYWTGLSPASKQSLELQGGIFSTDEAEAFRARPHALDAVALRRWDDSAKDPDARPPGWDHYEKVLRRATREVEAWLNGLPAQLDCADSARAGLLHLPVLDRW